MSAFSSLMTPSSAIGRPRPPRLPPLDARCLRSAALSGCWFRQYAESRIACAWHQVPSAFLPLQSAIACPSPLFGLVDGPYDGVQGPAAAGAPLVGVAVEALVGVLLVDH